MHINKLELKNIIISIAIFAVFTFCILANEFSFGNGLFISNYYISYNTILSIIGVIGLYLYLTYDKYFDILNVDRFNKYSIHSFLNIIVLYILTVIILVFSNVINVFIGSVCIILQIIYFILLVYIQGQINNINIPKSFILLSNTLLCILFITSGLNNHPFMQILIPINVIVIVLYCLLLLKQIYSSILIFVKPQ